MDPWVPVFYESAGFGLSEWINLASGLGGALLGAAIGALVSWLLQRSANSDALQRDLDATRAEQRVQLLKALFRASYVLADVGGTVGAIEKSLAAAKAAKLDTPHRWGHVGPIVGFAAAQPINAEELTALVDAKRYDLVADYAELLMQHDALNQSVAMYNEKRMAVAAELPSELRPNGALYTPLTEADERRLMPKFLELNSLIEIIEASSSRLLGSARKVTKDMGLAGRSIFDESFPLFDPDGRRE